MARRGILVRRLQAFETLAGINAVVFDKTGTLTQDRLRLQTVRTRPGVTQEQAVAVAGLLARGSLHPVSRAIAQAAESLPSTTWPGEIEEVAGQGVQLRQGEVVVLRLGSAPFAGLAPQQALSALPQAHLADEQGWMATFEMEEGLRDDAVQAVAELRALGIRTWLLSGDRREAAERVAGLVGVDGTMAEASPERKLEELMALQSQGWRVAMVGDGLNDGPVLARADVSFALGHGAPLAQAQSDFVIQGGQVMDVVASLRLARDTMRVVRQNLIWAALYNAVSVPLALVGWMPPWLAGLGMALSSLLVIVNALRLASRVPGAPTTVLGCLRRLKAIFHRYIRMDILYLLIPLSVLLVFGIIGVFWWALQAGQFDNIEREGERILKSD